jgi:hypothetical protein
MSFLGTLRKLLLGETWLLPIGLALAVVVTLGLRGLLGSDWHELGGFVLLACVAAALVVSVARSAGAPRRPLPRTHKRGPLA